MNVVMGMWVLLLGGGVLDAPADEGMQGATQEPAATAAPIIPSDQAPRRIPYGQGPATQPGNERNRRNGETALPGLPSDRRRGVAAAHLPADRSGVEVSDGMPLAPTDPGLSSESRLYGWVPPTTAGQTLGAGRTGSGAAARASPTGAAWSRMPVPPTARRGDATDVGSAAMSRSTMAPGRMGAYATTAPTFYSVPQPQPAKPFANYRSMPGVSPYLNLFRNDTSLGTIDNYTTLVRPQLEQRFFNQQIGRDVYGLERDSRAYGTALQQMGRERTPQGVVTPQFYMNFGNYFPSGSGEYGP